MGKIIYIRKNYSVKFVQFGLHTWSEMNDKSPKSSENSNIQKKNRLRGFTRTTQVTISDFDNEEDFNQNIKMQEEKIILEFIFTFLSVNSVKEIIERNFKEEHFY